MPKWKLPLKIILSVVVLGVAVMVGLNYSQWFVKPTFTEQAKTRHLVVISVDALNAKDFAQLQTLPNFQALLATGAYAKEVVGVYPSLTYPAHTSIITGTYPDKHGIVNNEVFQPGSTVYDWYWFKKAIKVPTLYELAKKQNLSVGALLWPVMGKADVDYNLPEIKAKAGENQTLVVLGNGTPFFLLDVELRYGKLRKGIQQPELDDFVTASAKHMITSKKPNLLLIHLTDTDEQRHIAGRNSLPAQQSLERQDGRIGEIIQATKDAGIYQDTTFVVLGDHGFLDVTQHINLNVEFKKAGLIVTDSNGKLVDWQAMLHSADGSAYIYLKDNNEATRKQVEEILLTLQGRPELGIEAVYNQEKIKELKVGADAHFMLEAKEGFYFTNDWDGELVTQVQPGKKTDGSKILVATHGYSPEKPDYFSFFLMSGPGVKKGAVIDRVNLVDEGPTLAALLGIEMQGVDGRVLTELLE